MNKNIFEYRTLIADDFIKLGVNLDERGKFYGLYIEVPEKLDADNSNWILGKLFPALSDWIYEKDKVLLNTLIEQVPDVGKLSRRERVTLYEMISTAMTLGWF